MILTSNQASAAGRGLRDRIIATAVLDRILHHAITLNIRELVPSQDELKAGLVRPAATQ